MVSFTLVFFLTVYNHPSKMPPQCRSLLKKSGRFVKNQVNWPAMWPGLFYDSVFLFIYIYIYIIYLFLFVNFYYIYIASRIHLYINKLITLLLLLYYNEFSTMYSKREGKYPSVETVRPIPPLYIYSRFSKFCFCLVGTIGVIQGGVERGIL